MNKQNPLNTDKIKHVREFSKRADTYVKKNIIQKKVASYLVSKIKNRPQKILDLGCGSGAVWENISWEYSSFIGVDSALNMCRLHPVDNKSKIINENFENYSLYNTLPNFDIIISASALQWATDIEYLFYQISQKTDYIAFAIFCDGTFKTIYDLTKLNSFLPSSSKLIELLSKYFEFSHETLEYKLEFNDNISKFRYIKESGVSGGNKRLSVKQMRSLIENYPKSYLEFEVFFVWGRVK